MGQINKPNKENSAGKYTEILDELVYLGLTHYEAELFLSLSRREMTARELSQATEIPYTKVYSVLEKLIGKNLVQRIQGNPAIFVVPEPAVLIGCLCDESRSRIDEIERHITSYLSENLGNEARSRVLKVSWGVVGSVKVQYYLQTKIKNSQHSIYVMDPGLRTIDSKLHELLKSKSDIEVKMVFSLADKKKIPEDLLSFSRIYDNLRSRYYIFDGETSFMISLEEGHDIYGIVEPCSNCVLQSRDHFDMIWERSEPLISQR